jgi:GTP cyclohydrolase II
MQLPEQITGLAIISVDRALRDLRAGLPVLLDGMLVAPYCAGITAAFALLSAERLQSMGFAGQPVSRVAVKGNEAWLLQAADAFAPANAAPPAGGFFPADPRDSAALQLLKHAALLPIALVQPSPEADADWLSVSAKAVLGYDAALAESLTQISDAIIPLHDIGTVRVIAFRPKAGGLEHLAILTGKLAADGPLTIPDDTIPVRLHSSCLTGDILGSMRCDCGEQLRKAIADSATQGGGVVLYLNQEGRGIGIANKLTAYRLQDHGHDTYDANLRLGYGDDERSYCAAAHMLKVLGISRITLMTNNPTKLAAIAALGITVESRTAHSVAANKMNENYLKAKKTKAGHLL